jgi:glucose/arabinose dehydrogenase
VGNPGGDPFPHSRVWSSGHRNSFGFGFDPLSGNLWETENGPHCNDELNRIVAGGNYAWGPHEEEDCSPAMPGALETNRDGPEPRRQPEAWWTPTIAPTGIAFCDRCGLGTAFRGTALMSDFNRRELLRITLTPDRLHVAAQRVVFHATAVTSVEVGPDHAVYISQPHAIERLERA